MELIMDKKYYVYILIDPRDDQPFYVGKGQDDRMYRHVWCVKSESKKKHTNPIRNKRIRELLAEGVQPKYKQKFFISEQEAFDEEIKMIIKYGKLIDGTGILTNMQDGGKGGTGKNKKTVYQYDDSKLITTFNSAASAADSMGVTSGSIRAACNPNIKQGTRIKGFLWSYLPLPPASKNQKERPIQQLNNNGQLIKEFQSGSQAAKELGLDRANIQSCCVGRNKTSGGYMWRYK